MASFTFFPACPLTTRTSAIACIPLIEVIVSLSNLEIIYLPLFMIQIGENKY